jgi:hypothetical protein
MKLVLYNYKFCKMKKKTSKSTKYIFTLFNVNTEVVDKKYCITSLSTNITEKENPPTNTTKLSELISERSTPEVISFLDESKRLHTCNISMIDFSTRNNTEFLHYYCFWCRHPFDSKPIGCPINYVSSQAVKTYFSETSKDIYTIKENITINKRQNMEKSTDTRISVNKREYYETDGVFCSFNCCKAFIEDNKHVRMYDNSNRLLMKMYNDMMGTPSIIIDRARNWRVLLEYGGHLTITDFRIGFNKIDYEYHGTIQSPSFRPLGMLFEEKIKF